MSLEKFGRGKPLLVLMLIKFGAIVIGGRGKMGGTVFSHNRGGDYAKNNAIPINPRTQYQQESRGLLTQLSQGWSSLLQVQIDAWNAAVDSFKRSNVWGDSKSLSGKNLYTSLNKNLVQVGQSIESLPPNPAAIVVPVKLNPAMDTGAGTLTTGVEFTGTDVPAFYQVVATPPVSAGTSFVKNKLRTIYAGAYGDADGPTDLMDNYTARFGLTDIDDKVYIGVYTVNKAGQRSPIITAPTIVTET